MTDLICYSLDTRLQHSIFEVGDTLLDCLICQKEEAITSKMKLVAATLTRKPRTNLGLMETGSASDMPNSIASWKDRKRW
jgi:hypothetical protein